MSRVVKSGVAAGIESLLEFGARAPIDAIITATGLDASLTARNSSTG
mgnify:CR=1 FL=1